MKGPKASTKIAIPHPSNDRDGGTESESDKTSTPNHLRKVHGNYSIGSRRAGRVEVADYSNPKGKLSGHGQRPEDSNQGLLREAPVSTGFQSTGSDLSGSNKYGRA